MDHLYEHGDAIEYRISVGIDRTDPKHPEYIYEWVESQIARDYADLLNPEASVEVHAIDQRGHRYMLRLSRDDVRPAGGCDNIWHRITHDEDVVPLCPSCRLRAAKPKEGASR